MPMVWNAEADAKLLSAIIKVYDVKVTGEKLKEVAQIIGPECTAKALTHRIAKIRNLAKEDGAEGGDGTTPKKQKTPAKATKPSTPAKNGKGGKKQAASRSPSPDDDEEATPASARPKRSTPKRNYAQMAGEDSADADGEDDDGLNKKVKIEVGEDIGEGLHEAADELFDFNFS